MNIKKTMSIQIYHTFTYSCNYLGKFLWVQEMIFLPPFYGWRLTSGEVDGEESFLLL